MRRELETRHCRILLAVAEQKGVGQAARVLGIAQSTVSETLLSLERVLGAAVIVRRRGGEGLLTPMALELIPLAQAVVAAADRALEAATMFGRNVTLRVGAVESISSYVLPRITASLRLNRPAARIEVVTATCNQLRERVAAGSLDVAFTLGSDAEKPSSSAYVRRALTPSSISIICAPEDDLTNAFAVERLTDRLILLPDADGVFPDVLRQWLGRSSSVARIDSAGSLDAVKRGVFAGAVVGVLPFHAVSADLDAGSIREIKPLFPLPPLAMESVLPTTMRSPESALKELLDLMGDVDLLPLHT